MTRDDWSSLDDGSSEDSFIASEDDTSSSSASTSSSDSSLSESSEAESSTQERSARLVKRSVTKRKSRAPSSSESETDRVRRRGSSTRSSTPGDIRAPLSEAKSSRKAALESLVKRRRISKPQNSDSDKSDHFVVSDAHFSDSDVSYMSRDFIASGSELSEGEMDPGFYARVSQMMDRKSQKAQSVSDSMSPRTAFLEMLKYYAVCLVSPGAEFPSKSKKLQKVLPVFEAARKKIERDLESRRDATKPSYWRPDSPHVVLLDTYPDFRRSRFSPDPDQLCDACNKRGRLAATVTLRGRKYDSTKLWKESNLKAWLKSHRLPLLLKSESGEEEDSSGGDSGGYGYEGPTLVCGNTCLGNVVVYHTLQHAKHRYLTRLYQWIVNQRLASSVEKLLEELDAQKDGIVEQWFEKYMELTTMSERNCDTFTDPLGTYSPPPQAKRISTDSNRRKSSRF